jgi:hypothetical protein
MARTLGQSSREDWWLLYHASENGSVRFAGRHGWSRFEWTADGWPLARAEDASEPMTKPVPAATIEADRQPLSDVLREKVDPTAFVNTSRLAITYLKCSFRQRFARLAVHPG